MEGLAEKQPFQGLDLEGCTFEGYSDSENVLALINEIIGWIRETDIP